MESKKKENKDNKENNISKLLILYDELQYSFEVAKNKIESIFSAIESHNDKNSKNMKANNYPINNYNGR